MVFDDGMNNVTTMKNKKPKMATKIPREITTPNAVKTRIGTLKFFDGFPTDDTVAKVYDNLVFMRGVEVFLNLNLRNSDRYA